MKRLTSNHLPEELVRGRYSLDRFMHKKKCGELRLRSNHG
jgi:hypothetical protein